MASTPGRLGRAQSLDATTSPPNGRRGLRGMAKWLHTKVPTSLADFNLSNPVDMKLMQQAFRVVLACLE